MQFRLYLTYAMFLIASWAFVGHATAQQDEKNARLEAARVVMLKSGVSRALDSIIPQISAQLLRADSKGRSELMRRELQDVYDGLETEFLKRKDELIQEVATIYANEFTAEELQAIAAFYETPVGQKLVRKLPTLISKSSDIGRRWGEKIGIELDNAAAAELKRRGLTR